MENQFGCLQGDQSATQDAVATYLSCNPHLLKDIQSDSGISTGQKEEDPKINRVVGWYLPQKFPQERGYR
ncbi:MAG: hypothetical protein WA294_01515 [Acidobacteriaceae bacterium]